MQPAFLVGLFLSFACSSEASVLNFLKSGKVSEREAASMLESELAMQSSDGRHRLDDIKDRMGNMYVSLPKNAEGKLSHEAVRYGLHRFFARRYGWFIRGLEPNNQSWITHNSSNMAEWVPSYLQDMLEQKINSDGADLDQLAALAAAMEDLIHKESAGRLATAFDMYGYPHDKHLNHHAMNKLMTTYYAGFLNSADFETRSREETEHNTAQFTAEYTNWAAAKMWYEDVMEKTLKTSNTTVQFESLTRVIEAIGEQYWEFNEIECQDLKETLRGMQGKKAGRVRLSAFYNKGMYSHWDFSEKKEYLRSLGALDETDPERPSVIIANYAMARPNCLDASNIYTICCVNECEALLGKLESKISNSTADVEQIVELVKGLSTASVASPREIDGALLARLKEIAAVHDGRVPLHGRLFAQWMHHAYPLECTYPHEIGSVNPLSSSEWMKETGHTSQMASTDEKMEHIQADVCAVNPEGGSKCAEEEPDLPWSGQEELLTAWHGSPHTFEEEPQRQLSGWMLLVCVLVAFGAAVGARYRKQMLALLTIEGTSSLALKPVCLFAVVLLLAFLAGLLDGWLLLCIVVVGVGMFVADRATPKAEDECYGCKAV